MSCNGDKVVSNVLNDYIFLIIFNLYNTSPGSPLKGLIWRCERRVGDRKSWSCWVGWGLCSPPSCSKCCRPVAAVSAGSTSRLSTRDELEPTRQIKETSILVIRGRRWSITAKTDGVCNLSFNGVCKLSEFSKYDDCLILERVSVTGIWGPIFERSPTTEFRVYLPTFLVHLLPEYLQTLPKVF